MVSLLCIVPMSNATNHSPSSQLAPSVSYFVNGSNFEPIDYNDIGAFQGVAPSETVEAIEVMTSESSSTTITKVAPQFKPDFTMTNSGLHIQVPMERFPIIRHFANDTEQHKYMHDLRFAFLACRVKRKPHLVAICLRVHHSGTFLRFSRTSFDGCAIHQFMYKRWSLPITRFNPVWVSKAPITATVETPEKLPSTTTRITFEVWYKGAVPVEKVLWSRMPDNDQQCYLNIPPDQLQSLWHHAPRTFMQSQDRIQHYITGSITIPGPALEVIAFRDKFLDEKAIDVAFGIIDRNVWVHFRRGAHPDTAMTPVWLRQHLLRTYDFPTGGSWQDDKVPICLVPGSEGSFEAKQNKGGPKCNMQYTLQRVGDEEIVLRVYLSPTEGRSLKGWIGKTLRK
jgi:hypothetical protein